MAQRPGETFSHSVRNAPAGQPPQSAQAPSESPPQPLRYDFDGQSDAASHETHRPVPDDVLYLPAPHGTQVPAAMPTHPSLFSPGGQTPQDSQAPGEVPPHPFRTCPGGQSQLVQAEAPLDAMYLLTSHAWHTLATAPMCVCAWVNFIYLCVCACVNFIHTCMQVHIVFACKRVFVCGKQIHT